MPMEYKRAEMHRKKGNINVTAGIIATLIAISSMIFLGALAGMRRVAEAPVFAPKTVINGVDIGVMSFEEGRAQILDFENEQFNQIKICLVYNGVKASFDASELGISTNAEQALTVAYRRNKTGQIAGDFNQYQEAYQTETSIRIDDFRLRHTIQAFLDANNVPAQDASASFDVASRKLLFTHEKNGISADANAVCELVKTKILKNDYSPLELKGKLVYKTYAKTTEAMLRKNTILIGQCSTIASNNMDRNANIQLMCDAIDGLAILPGETLSLNALVGQRTEGKGFRPAPSIIDGQLVNDIGGGICQLAGTLYNAALYANMEIVERVHHTWPSEYLPVGLDATLNWNNKDLKIKNNSNYPIYISAEFKNLVVKVELFGQPPPEGVEIDIETMIIKEIEAPAPDFVYTNKLPAGERRVKIASRKGYEVSVYRHYLKNGEIVMSEEISYDHFRAMRGTVYLGTDEIIK